MFKYLNNTGHTSWATGIKQIIFKLGCGFAYFFSDLTEDFSHLMLDIGVSASIFQTFVNVQRSSMFKL